MKIEVDLKILAKFMAGVIGKHCEIVVHDLADLSNSVVIIENGHHTGRKIGSPATNLALKKIKSIQNGKEEPYFLNYCGQVENGIEFRSSTLIISKNKVPRYMLCINIDDSNIKNILNSINELLPNYKVEGIKNETFHNSIEDVSNNIIQQAMVDLGINNLSRLLPDEKINFVKQIDDTGLFTIKGHVQKISAMIGISEQTLYRYLK
ncbi:PAS domain-containing protein [Vibrio sp. DW001]|uniref:helix-turn-helix transcriptional regulator n=1 Tax=Vibrio sp. DW001 TaxID=2912315 RepID=UPI0023AEE92D|nr:PAS domain-containing protein [Vibrio sp. DW001]WED28787.1 PAS domain-containing protein [Vibrio sp. DW001]